MDAPKLQVKLFSDNVDSSNLEKFIPVFHRWIRDHLLDELMIDVADYSHVHHGPEWCWSVTLPTTTSI